MKPPQTETRAPLHEPQDGNAAYRAETSRSKALFERAMRVMPGGNTRHSIALSPYPVYLAEGRGCRVTDVEGETRIDFLNNFTSLILGHADPQTSQAVQARLWRGTAFAAPTESDVALAELIVERVPGIDRVRFCNSGSEALMLAVKAARAFTGRAAIAKIEGAYHGLYDYVQVSEAPSPERWGPPDRPSSVIERGCSPEICQDVVVMPWNDADACERLIHENRGRLAGVIIDPLPLGLSLIAPKPGFLQRLREVTQANDILLIGDEVLSFRLGFHGAFELHAVCPDLLCLGKIIGGGFPVGLIGGRADVMSVFDHTRAMLVHHGGTYNGNPVTTTAGLATMRQMTPDAYDRLNALGETLRARLGAMLARRGIAAQVFGAGSLFSVRLTDDVLTNYRDVHRHIQEKPAYARICHEMLARGILMSQRGIMGCLSTPMTEHELDAFVGALEDTLVSAPLTG
jgi:glutamate-1-semialdehyde 2,1-aminomutase